MAALYADENVPRDVVVRLRSFGHDVLRAIDDGRANLGIDDPDVLARAIELQRAVLTGNRRHYHRLHMQQPAHEGIITFTDDADWFALAQRIDAAIVAVPVLAGQLIRVLKPDKPRQ